MRESMTLIEQTNIFTKNNHQNLLHDRLTSKTSKDVYSSLNNLTMIPKQTKEKFILPSIDKDNNRLRKKTKRPLFRTSIYHSNSRQPNRTELLSLTAHGKKPELIRSYNYEDTVMNFQRNHVPPPSPTDDQLEDLLLEINRTRQSTPPLPTDSDGYIPYRLPALHRSAKRIYTVSNNSTKDTKSSLSNYLQAYY